MAMLTGENRTTDPAASVQGSADQSLNASQASYGDSSVGYGQGFFGGVAGAGSSMPITAGLGAGAGGVCPETQYAAVSVPNKDTDQPNRMGGSNDKEFQGCRGMDGPEYDSHPEGTGPAPDRTMAGPGTGIPSNGIQQLP